MRVDANVSLARKNWNGERTEIKNMNRYGRRYRLRSLSADYSIAHVESAIEYEIERQREIVKNGGEIIFETRTVDEQG